MTIDERIASELRRHAPQVDEHMAWDRIRAAAPQRGRGRAIRLVSVSVSVAALGLFVGLLVVSDDAPSAAEVSPVQMDVVIQTVAAAHSRNEDGLRRLFADNALFSPVEQWGSIAVAEADSLGAWMDNLEAWGFEGDVTQCLSASAGVNCEVRARWHTLSAEAVEEWSFAFDGDRIQTLIIRRVDLDPGDRILPLGLGELDAWEDWLQRSDPATADRLIPEIETSRLIASFLGYDPTLADEIGESIQTYLSQRSSPTPTVWADMWPQSSLEEARGAQELADAGDPNVTWQLEPDLEEKLMDTASLENPEIFARFLQDELGWEGFSPFPGVGGGLGTITVTYVRCVPGENNSLYPGDQWGGRCAPTIDEFRYETVRITVAQPARQGPSGIWVVRSSEMVEPIEQVVPLSDAEATAILEAFLQARVDGEGAEQFGGAALLYATTTGTPYERFEFEPVAGSDWPSGRIRFEVRLFAEDGQTVVEQSFSVARDGAGRWGLEPGGDTVENGRALPMHDILGGEVTFRADHPWEGFFFGHRFESNGKPADANLYLEPEGQIRVLADPQPIGTDGCQEVAARADAEALAQTILSNGDFEATAPSAVTIGGAPALQMDVVTTAGARFCDGWPRSAVTTNVLEPGNRMRLYLVDLPGGSARILAIAIIGPEADFERVLEAATPVLDSFEFHTG